jgi:hypothetical protein
VPWILSCECIVEYRLGGVGLAERHKAGALVVGDVEAVVSKVHAVSEFLGLGSVHGIVGQILRLAECRCVAKARMGAASSAASHAWTATLAPRLPWLCPRRMSSSAAASSPL